MNPSSQVADLIMQLMMRGKSGGLPMRASPELTQYLAHAQGGTAPPQQRGMPSADVLPGPGSGAAAVREPFDFESAPHAIAESQADLGITPDMYRQMTGESQLSPLDLMTESPGHLPTGTFREGGQLPMFLWATNPRTGKRIRLDGPFENDIEAARALKEMRAAGYGDGQVEIAPDFDEVGKGASTKLSTHDVMKEIGLEPGRPHDYYYSELMNMDDQFLIGLAGKLGLPTEGRYGDPQTIRRQIADAFEFDV